jgi:hypothetical protein
MNLITSSCAGSADFFFCPLCAFFMAITVEKNAPSVEFFRLKSIYLA